MRKTKIGIIGGSGLYDIEGLVDATWRDVETPWGMPSDQVLTGTLNNVDMVFLPRHGRGHVFSPTTVPYRANIDALKRLGVTDVISVSACGSFRDEMAPGDFVIVDQFQPVPAFRQPAVRPQLMQGSQFITVEHIWQWKVHSFLASQKAKCIAKAGGQM